MRGSFFFMGSYDTAQICLSGHVITSAARQNPELRKEKCKKCGSSTIMACTNCALPIKGYYSVPGVINFSSKYSKPMFCENCGKPYPWTESSIISCKGLVELSEVISESERDNVMNYIESIIKSDAYATISKVKLNRTLSVIEPDLKEAIEKIINQF